MYPEYLYNNDTQDIAHRVRELALSDEPALRAHCQEVSHQTDTSSLCVKKDCTLSVNDANLVLSILAKNAKELSQSLSQNAGVFRTQGERADFSLVCRFVICIEEERLHLLKSITAITEVRRKIACDVAKANRVLHLLSIASREVSEDVRAYYAVFRENVQGAYARLTEMDAALCKVQEFLMIMVERHLSAFMEQLRAVSDLNHAGEALDRGKIRTLCSELQILISRIPNVSF